MNIKLDFIITLCYKDIMYILDENIELAVKSLTKRDILNYYSILYNHFNLIYHKPHVVTLKDKRGYRLYKQKTTLFNKTTALYYLQLFKQLELSVKDIYGTAELLNKEYNFNQIIEILNSMKEDGNIQYISNYNNGLLNIKEQSQDNIIYYNRLCYILMQHKITDFFYGVPTWYIFTEGTIYEKFSLKERKSIRITLDNNNFKYFIKDYTNDWIELKNIDSTVKSFISTILFQ